MEAKTLVQMVREEQSRHAAEAARRLGAARDRILGAAFWYGVSFVLPADWKWLAWLAASIGVCLALWNAEQGWVERNLARVSLSDL